MTDSHDKHAALERLIDRTLRAQPLLHAPGSLERRVLAQLGRRAERPWWRRNFMDWPLPARAAFLLVCVACVWAIVNSPAVQIFDGLASAVTWLSAALNVVSSVAAIGTYVVDSIPPFWLYAVAFVVAATYVAFFGLGAAAYRTLYK